MAAVMEISRSAWDDWGKGRYVPKADKMERLQAAAENTKHCSSAESYRSTPLATRIETWLKGKPRIQPAVMSAKIRWGAF
jgi:hypothetical protein